MFSIVSHAMLAYLWLGLRNRQASGCSNSKGKTTISTVRSVNTSEKLGSSPPVTTIDTQTTENVVDVSTNSQDTGESTKDTTTPGINKQESEKKEGGRREVPSQNKILKGRKEDPNDLKMTTSGSSREQNLVLLIGLTSRRDNEPVTIDLFSYNNSETTMGCYPPPSGNVNHRTVSTYLNGKIMMCQSSEKKCHVLNKTTNTWEDMPPLNHQRFDAMSLHHPLGYWVVGGGGEFVNGISTLVLSTAKHRTLEMYSDNTWSDLNITFPHPIVAGCAMNAKKCEAYVIGGYYYKKSTVQERSLVFNQTLNSVYHITFKAKGNNISREMSSLNTARAWPLCLYWKRKIMVAGGVTLSRKDDALSEVLKSAEVYDLRLRIWNVTEKALPKRWAFSTMVIFDGIPTIFGGSHDIRRTASADIATFKNGKWSMEDPELPISFGSVQSIVIPSTALQCGNNVTTTTTTTTTTQKDGISDYYLDFPGREWDEGRAQCVAHDSKLAEITSEKEQSQIEDFLRRYQDADNAWIGISYDSHSHKWVWNHTGREAEYTNWESKSEVDHNIATDNSCGAIGKKSGKWTNKDCKLKFIPLCEKN